MIYMVITKRDTLILTMCLEQKFMTLLQISKMFFPESRDILHVPMKRVCGLVRMGHLRVIKPRVGEKRLYVTTSQGAKLLKERNLSSGLRAVKEIDYRTWTHDEWVTDVRIVFEKLLDIQGWVSERILKKSNDRKKVPDGLIPRNKHWSIMIEVERTLKKKRYYERIFSEAYVRYPREDIILYLMANSRDKTWLMERAKSWKHIYFATMKDLNEMEWEIVFENATPLHIEFRREDQGGVHFNAPDIPDDSPEDDGLDDVREAAREYDLIDAEYKQLKAQGLSEKEIDKLWGIKE
jgi:hypothetical protein